MEKGDSSRDPKKGKKKYGRIVTTTKEARRQKHYKGIVINEPDGNQLGNDSTEYEDAESLPTQQTPTQQQSGGSPVILDEAEVISKQKKHMRAEKRKQEEEEEGSKKKKRRIGKRPKNTRGRHTETLRTRSTPELFVQAMQELTEAQKESIREIGFGSLIDFRIDGLPLCLGHWLVKKFDANKCCLEMENGETIEITEEDVHITLGIPMGQGRITKQKKTESVDLVKEWRSEFKDKSDVVPARIKPNTIAERMASCVDGGPEFNFHFLLLFHTLLVESNSNGSTNETLVKILKEDSDIKNLNWCGLVIENLVDTKRQWDKHRSVFFKGPLLFLTLFYVDRVTLFSSKESRRATRTIPVFLSWTKESLKRRETDEIEVGFGKGRVQGQQKLPLQTTNRDGNQEANQPIVKGSLLEMILSKTKQLATIIVELSDLTSQLPDELKTDKALKVVMEAGGALLGMAGEEPSDSQRREEEAMAGIHESWNNSEDPFWKDPALIECLEQVEKASTSKSVLRKANDDMPSFNLFESDFLRSPVMPEATPSVGIQATPSTSKLKLKKVIKK